MTEIHFVFRISRIIVLLFFSVRTGALFLLRTCYVISWFENAASSASVNSSLTGGFLQFLQILQFYSFFFIVFYCFVCQIALLSLRRFFLLLRKPSFYCQIKKNRLDYIEDFVFTFNASQSIRRSEVDFCFKNLVLQLQRILNQNP